MKRKIEKAAVKLKSELDKNYDGWIAVGHDEKKTLYVYYDKKKPKCGLTFEGYNVVLRRTGQFVIY